MADNEPKSGENAANCAENAYTKQENSTKLAENSRNCCENGNTIINSQGEKYIYKPTRFMLPTSHYDKKRADRAVIFIENLKHTKGVWAGKPFKLFPWQEQIIRDLFGVIKPNGYRQFNTAYVELPKKSGKSELAAAIALYMLCADNEEAAEIYGCACDRGQASIVFDVARDMVLQSPLLTDRIKIVESQKRLVYMPTRSIYQALSSDVASKYGYNVHACIFDELLGQPNRKLFDVMTKGAGAARKQPLSFVITTAGSDRTSICYEQHQKAADLLAGRKKDPTFYPVLYSAPEDADWTDPKTWFMANPSLGKTVDVEYYAARCESAKENPAEEIQFRQFHLCQWTNTAVRWMPMDKWDACGEDYALEDLAGRPCYAGLDLSSTSDLTAFVLVFPPQYESEKYRIMPFFWLPSDTLQLRVRRDHVMYDVWAKQGFINTTEGNVVHYGFIEKFICHLNEIVEIKEIAYDRWNASMMVQTLQDDGFTMVPFGQGFKDMSSPTKDLMRMVLEKSIAQNGHPVLRWNIDNIFVRTDPAGNLKAIPHITTKFVLRAATNKKSLP